MVWCSSSNDNDASWSNTATNSATMFMLVITWRGAAGYSSLIQGMADAVSALPECSATTFRLIP